MHSNLKGPNLSYTETTILQLIQHIFKHCAMLLDKLCLQIEVPGPLFACYSKIPIGSSLSPGTSTGWNSAKICMFIKKASGL